MKNILSSVFGNFMEWYDFSIYMCLYPLISQSLIPNYSVRSSSIIMFLIFFVGFLARPIGGFLFGYISDIYSQKKSLLISISLMLISTSLVSCIPSYKLIGNYSIYILLILRIIQGLSISGELTNSAIFISNDSEYMNQKKSSSLIMASIYIGLMFGFISTLITMNLIDMNSNLSWRIPFLFSLPIGIYALKIRYYLPDTYKHRIYKKKYIKDVFSNVNDIIMVSFLFSCLAISIYILIGYIPQSMMFNLKLSINYSILINIISMAILSICVVYLGFTKIKSIKLLVAGFVCMTILFIPLSMILNTNIYLSLLAIICILFYLPLIASSIMDFSLNIFPLSIKCTALSTGYNISMSIFGGSAPLIITLLKDNEYFIMMYFVMIAIISILAYVFFKKRSFSCHFQIY